MKYFYGKLIIVAIFYIFVIAKIISLIIDIKKNRVKKLWWIMVVIMIPLLTYCMYSFLIPLCMDLKYAIKGETSYIEGKIEKVYMLGGLNPFIIEGKEFTRNPWNFKPKEGETYKINYLPNSKYVVDYELISN